MVLTICGSAAHITKTVHLEVNRYHFLYLPLQKIQLILR